MLSFTSQNLESVLASALGPMLMSEIRRYPVLLAELESNGDRSILFDHCLEYFFQKAPKIQEYELEAGSRQRILVYGVPGAFFLQINDDQYVGCFETLDVVRQFIHATVREWLGNSSPDV